MGHKGVFSGSDSGYWLSKSGDVSARFTEDGGIERETGEAGDDALGESEMRKILGRERERTEWERTGAAIRSLPHISGCDFGNCS